MLNIKIFLITYLKYHETILIFYVEYKNIFDHLLIIICTDKSVLAYKYIMRNQFDKNTVCNDGIIMKKAGKRK